MKYNLTAEELKNPNLVFEDLVSSMSHEEVKDIAWLWLKATVTDGYSTQLEKSEKEQLLNFFEHVVKMVDGVYYKYEDFSVGRIREQELTMQD